MTGPIFLQPTANAACPASIEEASSENRFVVLAEMNLLAAPNPIPSLEIDTSRITGASAAGFSLLDILPGWNTRYSASELKGLITKNLLLIDVSEQALTKFRGRHFIHFDPLVGENCCQGRAVMLAKISNSEGLDERLLDALKALAGHSACLKTLFSKIPGKLTPYISLYDFLTAHKAVCTLSKEIQLIILSYILTKAKKIEPGQTALKVPTYKEISSSDPLVAEIGATSCFWREVILKAQKILSKQTVAFVQSRALRPNLNDELRLAVPYVFGHHVITDRLGREIAPMYHSTLFLLESLESRVPLALRVNQFIQGEKTPYSYISILYGGDSSDQLSRAALCIYAKSITTANFSLKPKSLKRKIESHNIRELILSASAAHPQHGCNDKFRPKDVALERHQRLAYEWGTSRLSDFLPIEHIYCDDVSKPILERLDDVYFLKTNSSKYIKYLVFSSNSYSRNRNFFNITLRKNTLFTCDSIFKNNILEDTCKIFEYWCLSLLSGSTESRHNLTLHAPHVINTEVCKVVDRLFHTRLISFEERSALEEPLRHLNVKFNNNQKLNDGVTGKQIELLELYLRPYLKELKDNYIDEKMPHSLWEAIELMSPISYHTFSEFKNAIYIRDKLVGMYDESWRSWKTCQRIIGSEWSLAKQSKVIEALYAIGCVLSGDANLEKKFLCAGACIPTLDAQKKVVSEIFDHFHRDTFKSLF